MADSSPRPGAAAPTSDVLSMDDIVARHAGKWVLIQVTQYEEGGWPAQGRVLACSPSRKKLSAIVLRELKKGTLSRPYYWFHAVPLGKTLAEWRQTLERPGIETVDA